MNLPNRLTIMRIILVPFFVLFLLCDNIPYSALLALLVFAVASITDYLDGKIARSRNLITNFGKFLDPMADKVLVLSALICLSHISLCSPIVVIIVAAREFMVSSLRLVAASQGVVLAAGWSGKIKTASQMLSIVAVLIMLSFGQLSNAVLPTGMQNYGKVSNCIFTVWVPFRGKYAGVQRDAIPWLWVSNRGESIPVGTRFCLQSLVCYTFIERTTAVCALRSPYQSGMHRLLFS